MKIFSLFFILLFSIVGFSQNPIEKDSVQKELLFFSNNSCGKCKVAKKYFDEHKMPYQNLTIKQNRPLMYEFIHQKTKGRNIGISYPVLVYGDSIYFNMKNLNAVLSEIEKMMNIDGKILENNLNKGGEKQ